MVEERRRQRDRFREILTQLGFGQYQKSLWITPHQIEKTIDDYIASNNLGNFMLRFRSRKLLVSEGRELAIKAWQLTELNKAYEKFIVKWEQKLKEKALKFSDRESLRFSYYNLLQKDPHLPYELLPDDWTGSEAYQIYYQVEEYLLKSANKHHLIKL